MIALVLGVSIYAQAELINRGTDSLGNRLIYDTDLNITWYDYSNAKNYWQNQVNWANSLSVTFGGNVYDDWRLPITVDGAYVFGYDGTSTGGYNITSSEMGHLYYLGLGNKGWYDTSGNLTGCRNMSPWCLTNLGDFQNLYPDYYWSGTEYSATPNHAWWFITGEGAQSYGDNRYGTQYANSTQYAIAVRPGDISVVPEPISSLLFIAGGVTLAVKRYLRRSLNIL